MNIVTASSRGQIVIPKEIRNRLNIVAGKKLSIKAEEDHVLLTALPDDLVEAFCGIFQEKSSLTNALTEHREKDKLREKKSLLDSFALLAYLNKEDGFDKVRRLLADAQSSSQPVLMNELNE